MSIPPSGDRRMPGHIRRRFPDRPAVRIVRVPAPSPKAPPTLLFRALHPGERCGERPGTGTGGFTRFRLTVWPRSS
jgi:hypothetical protein